MIRKNKNPRLIFLDFTRVLAFLLIVIHHFAFHLESNHFTKIKELFFFRLSLGDIGVSLFIFLSGLTLTISSLKNKNWSIISFYKKRAIRIYPLYWLIYSSFLVYYLNKNYLSQNISVIAIVLAFLGLDGYLSCFFKFHNWYLVGEWFLGFIIILYIIYPLLFKLFTKRRIIFIISNIIVFYLSAQYLTPLIPNSIRLIPVRLMEFSFGMYFSAIILRTKKINYFLILIIALSIFTFLTLLKFASIFALIIRLISIDIITILLAFYLFSFVRNNFLSKIIIFFSNISYSVFLVHKIVLMRYLYNVRIHREIYSFGFKFDSVYFYVAEASLLIFLVATFFYLLEKLLMKYIFKIKYLL